MDNECANCWTKFKDGDEVFEYDDFYYCSKRCLLDSMGIVSSTYWGEVE